GNDFIGFYLQGSLATGDFNLTSDVDFIIVTEKDLSDVGWGKELLENPEPRKNRFYQSYLVLNYCRMLHDLHKGEINSKLAGIEWAKSNLDPQWISLINFCWQERQDTSISVDQPANAEVFASSLKFVRYAIEKGKSYQIV
ncbi:DUF4111 domain-containing protein, partial [Candidatus Parcubacteria bacterium]|nr:DUF4111 domain-containing protein [Candidatus Parcubacteria bacterium]